MSTATPTTASTTATPLCQQNSGNNNTTSTISTCGNNDDHLGYTTVISTHSNTKSRPKSSTTSSKHTTNNNTPNKNNRSFLKSIIEDIQFCGMYFCGIDTTVEDDGQLTDKCKDGRMMYGTPSKEARAREMDDSLLGKFVMCTGCGPNV